MGLDDLVGIDSGVGMTALWLALGEVQGHVEIVWENSRQSEKVRLHTHTHHTSIYQHNNLSI